MAQLVGEVDHQPLLEEIADFERQAQHDVAGLDGARGPGSREDRLDLRVVDRRDERRRHDRDRDARFGKAPDRVDPLLRRCGTGLHGPGELRVERRDGQRHLHQPFCRHGGQDVDVARDQGRLRHDADGMVGPGQDFEDRAHHATLALDRLIGIGIGADRDRAGLVARDRQFPLELARSALLDEELGLEIEPRRQSHEGVGRPGEAIDAAVFAAAVGIDGAIEGNIGRIVAGDDGLGLLDRDLRNEASRVGQRFLIPDFGLTGLGFVASRPIADGTATVSTASQHLVERQGPSRGRPCAAASPRRPRSLQSLGIGDGQHRRPFLFDPERIRLAMSGKENK